MIRFISFIRSVFIILAFGVVSSNLQLPYVWRKNGEEVGFPNYIIGCEEDGKYFCNIVNATKEDEVNLLH